MALVNPSEIDSRHGDWFCSEEVTMRTRGGDGNDAPWSVDYGRKRARSPW